MPNKYTQIGIIHSHKLNMCKILFDKLYTSKNIIDQKIIIFSPNGKITVKKVNFICYIQYSDNKDDRRLFGIVRDDWDCVMDGTPVYLKN